MDFVMPEHLRAIYNDLKKNFCPQAGDFFFFDLSTEGLVIQKLSNIDDLGDLVKEAYDDKRPYAAMYHDSHDGPVLAFGGAMFILEESLITGKNLGFFDRTPVKIEKLKSEIQELKKLLNSKAC